MAVNVLRRNERDGIKNVHRSSCKVPSFLSDLHYIWNILVRWYKKSSNIKFI